MLTDEEILKLIMSSKKIVKKIPARGYKEEDSHKRCDLTLNGVDNETVFSVFIRQNSQFIENYSIGLRYRTADGYVTLVRYNGPHGEKSQHEDGHYDKPHIHRLTAEEMRSGSHHPQEKHREITDKYNTFDECLGTFFVDINIANWSEYFPPVQKDLFNGHR